jgi:pimeloyl-ACP methyl ester carboxylesterase
MNNNTADLITSVATGLGALQVQVCGTGPPAVLWHSLFVDSTTWHLLRDELAQDRRLIIIDGPCHGGSEATAHGFTVQDCAEAAGQVLDHLGVVEPVDWVGNAWGGHVGIMFAATQPTRCRSLVTIGTPIRALTRAERRRIVPLVVLYRLLGPVRPLVKGVEDALLGTHAPSCDKRLISTAITRSSRRGMYTAMRAVMLERPDAAPALATVTAPTLLIIAADDPLWPPSEAHAAAAPTHRAVATVPGAGHVAPLLQSPNAVRDLLRDFWQDPVHFADRHEHTESQPNGHRPL